MNPAIEKTGQRAVLLGAHVEARDGQICVTAMCEPTVYEMLKKGVRVVLENVDEVNPLEKTFGTYADHRLVLSPQDSSDRGKIFRNLLPEDRRQSGLTYVGRFRGTWDGKTFTFEHEPVEEQA